MNRKTFFKTIGAACATIALGAFIAGCPSNNGGQGGTDKPLKIGAMFPLTGNLAFLGQPEAAALRVAVDEINSSEGKQVIELSIEDAKGDAKDAVAAARKLTDTENIDLGMISTSALANAVVPIFQSSDIPLFTFCSDDTVADKNDVAANVYVNLESEQEVLAKYLISQKINSISVIRVNAQATERGIALLKKFGEGKIRIVNDLTYETTTSDYKNLIVRAKSDSSQAIYLMGYGVEFPVIVKAMRQAKVEKRILGNYMFLSDAARKEGANLYQDIDFTAFMVTPEQIASTPFGAALSKALGTRPGPFMDYIFVYEATKIWYNSIKQGVAPKDVSQHIRGKTFDSIFGKMYIASNGNAVVPMAIASYMPDGKVKIKWKLAS